MYGAYPSAPKSLGVGVCRIPPFGFVGASTVGTLPPGHHLLAGETLTSPNGKGRLVMQTDGNLVLYGPNDVALWNTGKNGGQHAEMQTDGNFVVYNHAGHAVFDTRTSGHPGAHLSFQDDGNLVVYAGNTALWQAHTTGWTPPKETGIIHTIEHAVDAPIQTVVRAATGNANIVVTGVSVDKVPVLGDVVNIVGEAASAPFKLASAIASGERLDHALVGALKDQLKIIKDVAPYAQMVVSVVPGLGSGVAAAMGTGIALAEGQSITAAIKAGVRSALPGGPLVQAGFDAALKVAAGENIGKAALEGVRSQLSPQAQKAFDVGLAVVTGEKIQTALAKGLASLAPGQVQALVAAGQKAIGVTPGLADALKGVASGEAAQGFHLAAGLLGQAGINEKALAAVRNGLPANVRQGFDTVLKTQEKHIPWLANVTGTPSGPAPRALEPPRHTATQPSTPAPQALEPPKKVAGPAPAQAAPRPLEPPKKAPGAPPTRVYGPYPRTGALSAPPHPPHGGHEHGGHGGHVQPTFRRALVRDWGWGAPWAPEAVTTVETCRTWSDPIEMPVAMEKAARMALGASQGRPSTVRGPDNVLYLFSFENGALTARACAAVATA